MGDSPRRDDDATGSGPTAADVPAAGPAMGALDTVAATPDVLARGTLEPPSSSPGAPPVRVATLGALDTVAAPLDVHARGTLEPPASSRSAPRAGVIGTLDTVASSPDALASLDTVLPDAGGLGTLDTLEPAAGGAPHTGRALQGRMGRYAVLRELGRGGMGVVYAAYDPELDRKVALKVLHPSQAGGTDAAARLQREGRAIAKLAHPNVVTVFDVGTERGSVFVAMELVDGGSLDGWLAREPRPWREVLSVFLQAGDGLAAAHEAGLVHRDFKPANVLIGTDGRARVTDFGLARPPSETAPPATEGALRQRSSDLDLTATGAVVGTPAYMPPEQFDAAPLDARSDQFSFAVSLYEGLYGERPFAGKTLGEIYDAITSGQIRPAPAKTSVPAWLRTILLRALCARPEDRYPDLATMLDELRRDPSAKRRLVAGIGAAVAVVAAGMVLLATRSPAADPCEHVGDRADAVWTTARASALRGALLATGRPYANATATTVIDYFSRYTASWKQLRRDTCEAEHAPSRRAGTTLADRKAVCLDQRLRDASIRLDAIMGEGGRAPVENAVDLALRTPSLETCLDEEALSVTATAATSTGAHVESGLFESMISHAQADYDLGRYEAAKASSTRAMEIARTLDDPGQLATAQCVTGDIAVRLGRAPEAEEMFRACALSAARAHDDPRAANAWVGLLGVVGFHQSKFIEALRYVDVVEASLLRAASLPALRAKLDFTHGLVLDEMGEHEAASALIEKAYNVWSKSDSGVDRLAALNALNSLGGIREEQAKYAEAKKMFERVLATREALLGREHSVTLHALQNLALTLDAMGDRKRALELYDEAVTRTISAVGPDHPDLARVLTNRAATKEGLGNVAEGLADEQRALAIREKALGPDHPDIALTVGNMANTLADLGRYDEAEAALARARQIDEKSYGPDSPKLAFDHASLGRLLYRRQKLDAAEAAFARALAIREKALGDHPQTADAASSLGIVQIGRNELDRATVNLSRALAIHEKTLGPEHPDLGYDLGSLAQVLMKRGKAAEAIPVAQRALDVRTRGKVDPGLIAEASFFVGQAMYLANQDRPAALARIVAARAVFVGLGVSWKQSLDEVDRFLKTKRP